jgi:hypothetical protein
MNANRKNYIVIVWNEYENEWKAISEPLTHKSAMWHLMDKPNAKRDVLRVDLWEKGYRPKPL